MIVSYDSRDLLEKCLSLEGAGQLMGNFDDAGVLVSLLADIEAMDDAGLLMALFGAESIVLNDTITVPIGPNHRAMFVAIGEGVVRRQDGSVDWARVHRLKLLNVSRRQ